MYSLPFNLKFNLFEVLCTSLFGSQLWLDKAKTAKSFTKFSVSYHLALKKLLGFPKFFSNHIACSILNVFTLRHQVHFNVLKFFLWLKECKSICFSFHRNYFLRFSYFRRLLDSLFLKNYDTENILENDPDALVSRMFFVQNHERSSGFTGFPN